MDKKIIMGMVLMFVVAKWSNKFNENGGSFS